MTTLPPFLQPAPQDPELPEPCISTIFAHPRLSGSAHALWWPSECLPQPRAVLLFIPGEASSQGNPGLVEFYTPFLTEIHTNCAGKLAILAHAHLGHSPTIPYGDVYSSSINISLAAQVESVIEAIDALHTTYSQARVVVAAHSMGCWITMQVLWARPDIISSVFLLFPTIAHIAQTPNGRSLSWLFQAPFPRVISFLSILARTFPVRALQLLFPHWPAPQILVLHKLLRSPSAIYACLILADQEMKIIRELDVNGLQAFKHQLHMFFAGNDSWVGEQKEVILRAFNPDPGSVRIVHGHPDIPHAFCINHGQELAAQCLKWLRNAELI